MKKIITIMFLCSVLLVGCSPMEKVRNDNDTSMFVEIERNGIFRVVAHKKTRVMYAVSNSTYDCGTFTLLVNADGTPMLYEEDKE